MSGSFSQGERFSDAGDFEERLPAKQTAWDRVDKTGASLTDFAEFAALTNDFIPVVRSGALVDSQIKDVAGAVSIETGATFAVVDLTEDRVPVIGASGVLEDSGLDDNGTTIEVVTGHTLTITDLTAGRIPKIGTAGLIEDSLIREDGTNVGIGLAPDGKLDVDGELVLKDGITAPGTTAGKAKLFVDSADGDLKIRFGDGTLKVIVTDT